MRNNKSFTNLLGKPVYAEWEDSHQKSGWTNAPIEEAKPLLCQSVGWLIADHRHAITLAANVIESEFPQRSGEMTIPKKTLTRVKAIKI